MLLGLSLLGHVLQSYIYLYRESYIGELFISFLPYAIRIDFVMILFSLYKIRYQYREKKTFLTACRYIICSISIWFAISYSLEYLHIYTHREAHYSDQTLTSSGGLSFLYANIYYKNQDFSGLASTIESYQPDIILLVEYAKIHDEVLTPLLKAKYPYVSRYVGGKGYDGDVIYSRYPLKKIKHTVYPGSFSHVSIEYNNKNVDFALIHTSAPVSPYFFTMRNEQLHNLSDLLTTYYTDHPTKQVILLGDFNLTPRSSYYAPFDQSMRGLGLSDITTDLTQTQYDDNLFPYTRCHAQAPYMCSHIDHVRSNNTGIQLEKIDMPGSDHDGFVGKL